MRRSQHQSEKDSRRVVRFGAASALALAAYATLMPAGAAGATLVWDGSEGTDFETPNNWFIKGSSPETAPAAAPANATTYANASTIGDFVEFNTPGANLPSISVSRSIGGVTFNEAGWTLGTTSASNILTVAGSQQLGLGIVSNGAGTNTINANITFAGRDSDSLGFTVGTGNTLVVNGNLAKTYAGASGTFSGGVVKSGAGTLELYGTGSLSRLNVNAGTVKAMAGGGGLQASGGTIRLQGTGVYDLYGVDVTTRPDSHSNTSTFTNSNATTAHTLTINGSTATNTTFGNLFSGNLNVSWSNENFQAPTYTISRTDNSYTGYTRLVRPLTVASLANGLQTSSIGASSNAAGNLQIGSTLTYTGGATSTDRNFTAIGNATIESSGSGALVWTGAMTPHTAAMTLTLGGNYSGANEFSSVITNYSGSISTSLTKAGTGSWLVSGANDYRGTTVITGGGVLEVKTLADAGSASGIGASTVANVNSTSQFYVDGTLRYSGDGSSTNRLFTINSAVGSATIDSSGSNPVSFTNTNALGTFLQTQSPGNNYSSGATTITVRDPSKLVVGMGILNGNGSIPTGTVITQINGTTVTLSNATTGTTDSGQSLFFVGGPRSLVLGGANGGENSMASLITDPAATFTTNGKTATSTATNTTRLTKSGAGVWKLTGANTYTGGTSIVDGTLLLANSSGSATGTGPVNVAAGVLGGTGSANGVVTIGDGAGEDDAIIAPGIGNTPDDLAVASLVLASDAVARLQLNSSTLANDLVASTGSVSLGNGVATLQLTDLAAATLTDGQQFTLFTGSAVSGYFAGLAPISGTSSALFTVGNNDYKLDYLSNSVVATVVVPEPATLSALGLLGTMLLRRRRA